MLLWGIILTALNLIEGSNKSNGIVAACEQSVPPFLMSDCFQYLITKDDSKKLMFLKVILKSKSEIAKNNEITYDTIKKFKKIKYLTFDDFHLL